MWGAEGPMHTVQEVESLLTALGTQTMFISFVIYALIVKEYVWKGNVHSCHAIIE
jgi:hypothetical protein